MADAATGARLADLRARRISSSSGARVQEAHFAPCVLDLLGAACPQAHAAVASAI
jgi:hypothetical protein